MILPTDAASTAAFLDHLPAATIKLRLVELLERQARQGQPMRNIGYYAKTLFYEAEPRLKATLAANRQLVAALTTTIGRTMGNGATRDPTPANKRPPNAKQRGLHKPHEDGRVGIGVVIEPVLRKHHVEGEDA